MSSPKSIKENIARAKSYGQRKDYMRCLHALSLSLDELASSKVFGREKFEIGILIDEVFRQLLAMEELKRVLPRGLKYVKGQEKKLAAMLMKIHDTIKNALERLPWRNRLVKSGFPADGVEYLERAIEKTPSDSRPYISILLAYEMMTEQDKALEVIKDIVRRFGANESIYI
ncbi:hypothetical protein ADUPG1_000772, partial [Aduncisulcus paluster]